MRNHAIVPSGIALALAPALAALAQAQALSAERGKMVPSVVLALKLARALGVAVDALFSLDRWREPSRPTREGALL